MLEPTELRSETEREQEASCTEGEGNKQSRASDQFGAGVSDTPPPLTHVSERGAGSGHQVHGDVEVGGTDRFRPQDKSIANPPTAGLRLSDSGDGRLCATSGAQRGAKCKLVKRCDKRRQRRTKCRVVRHCNKRCSMQS